MASLDEKAPFFLLAARRGASGLSVCADCREVLLCPNCQRALIAQSDDGYRCLHCKHTGDVFTSCAKCGGMRFLRRIPGSQAIERVTKSLFPRATVVRIDADSERFSSKNADSLRKKYQTADIIVGTPAAAHLLASRASAFSGAGIPDADAFLRWPEYDSEEHTFHLFLRIISAIKRQGNCIIQTRTSDHRVIKGLLSAENTQTFLRNTLEERKLLSYPPFSKLLLSTGTHRDEATLLRQCERVEQLLQKTLPSNTRISPPFIPIREKSKHLHTRRILAKIPLSWDDPIPKSLHQVSHLLPSNWRTETHLPNIL
jgi:primosomal protein N' (replication factor Y)